MNAPPRGRLAKPSARSARYEYSDFRPHRASRNPAAIYRAWSEGHFTLLTCAEQLDELRATLRKPTIADGQAAHFVGYFLIFDRTPDVSIEGYPESPHRSAAMPDALNTAAGFDEVSFAPHSRCRCFACSLSRQGLRGTGRRPAIPRCVGRSAGSDIGGRRGSAHSNRG